MSSDRSSHGQDRTSRAQKSNGQKALFSAYVSSSGIRPVSHCLAYGLTSSRPSHRAVNGIRPGGSPATSRARDVRDMRENELEPTNFGAKDLSKR